MGIPFQEKMKEGQLTVKLSKSEWRRLTGEPHEDREAVVEIGVGETNGRPFYKEVYTAVGEHLGGNLSITPDKK
jgi:hypothetical protein